MQKSDSVISFSETNQRITKIYRKGFEINENPRDKNKMKVRENEAN